MDNNNFMILLQAMLDKAKSIVNIKKDIKSIESDLEIKLHGTLDKAATKNELGTSLDSMKSEIKVNADTSQADKKINKVRQQKVSTTIRPTVDNSQIIPGLKEAQKETKTLWEKFTSGIAGISLIEKCESIT